MARNPLQATISIALLAAIWIGSWADFRAHTTEHREQFDKLGSALVGASEGALMRQCRAGRYDPIELHAALDELRAGVGAARLALLSKSEGVIAQATAPRDEEGGSTQLFETPFVPPLPRGLGRRGSEHGSGQGPPGFVDLPAGALSLELDLSTDVRDARLAADLHRFLGLALALSVALLLLLVLLAARGRAMILARDLGRAQEELRGLQFLRRLGAGLAHETRNPLGILRGFAQELASGHVPAKDVPRIADTIIEEADRTVSRLDEFMLLSRPANLRRERFDLHALLVDLGSLLQPDLEAAQAELEIEAFRFDLDADKEQTRRLFMNLMLNGVQSLQPGGTLKIESRQGDGTFELRVVDDGPGVPVELRETLFEPYVSKREGGTGLGLAIVRRIATEHGWQVDFEPAQPRGAVFIVRGLGADPQEADA